MPSGETHIPQEDAMIKTLAAWVAAVVAVLAGAIAAATAAGTPSMTADPAEAAWVPVESPAGGPYFGTLDLTAYAGPRDEPFFVDLGPGSSTLTAVAHGGVATFGAYILDPEVPSV
jgi:hypothetical protein